MMKSQWICAMEEEELTMVPEEPKKGWINGEGIIMAFMFQGATELIEDNEERENKKKTDFLVYQELLLKSYLENKKQS